MSRELNVLILEMLFYEYSNCFEIIDEIDKIVIFNKYRNW